MKEEHKKSIEDRTSYRLFMFWFWAIMLFIFSIALNEFILGVDGNQDVGYFDYFLVNPLSNDKISENYFKNNLWYPIFMMFTTIILRLFFFGNPKKKYISKLENIKRKILNVIPFYFDGKDPVNDFIKFGFESSFKNGFLERKISDGDYLQKVSFLEIFTKEYSPDKILNLKSDFIKRKFLSEEYYVEVFKIVEGYIWDNINSTSNIPLSKYWAIGTETASYTNESIEGFIKENVSKKKNKRWGYDRKNALNSFQNIKAKEKTLKTKKAKDKLYRLFINKLTQKKEFLYLNYVNKMIIFSPLALKESIEIIGLEAEKFLKNHIMLDTSLIKKINEYNKVNVTEFIEIAKFLTFYKIISMFVGLPSGIITARIDDYNLSRIVDDIEHFENNKTIRQIKPFVNDKRGKYDDTYARAYMIFHHEFFSNSQNNSEIRKIFDRFDGLRTLSLDVLPNLDFSNMGITEKEKFEFVKKNLKTDETGVII